MMSQKHAKFMRNLKEYKLINNYYEPRRPLLFSSDDVERMAQEKTRAKLIRQLVSKPPESSGEFGSYYYGTNRLKDPISSATTHRVNDHELSHNPVNRVYPPMGNNMPWNPGTTEKTSIYNCQTNARQNTGECLKFTCRCKACGGKHCRGQLVGEYKQQTTRNNITRFIDSSTMTPKLNDACCGSCTPMTASRKTSDASVSSSDIAVKEKLSANCSPIRGISQFYMNPDPISILKKKRCENIVDYEPEEDDNNCAQTEKKCRIVDDFQEAVRDTEEDIYQDFNQSKQIKSFPKVVRNKHHNDLIDTKPRKNIYNEGISDLTINLLPAAPEYPERFQVTKKIKPGHSKTAFMRQGTQKRDEMPFSHNTESRYHSSCRTPQVKYCFGSNDADEHEASVKKFRKTYASNLMSDVNTQSVKFPRKVLTSEKDIDSYVGGRFLK